MTQSEEIKERLNIVDIVSEYVKLQKAGKNYKGLSPFTNEKTPSFYVSPDKSMFYCFSSNKGGDVFTFIEEVEQVDFMGALKMLADKAGISLKQENPEKRDERARLYECLEAATVFFQKNLAQNKKAFGYLIARGIHTETIKKFRIGFAPDAWEELSRYLKNKNFTEKEIIDVGLAIARAEGKTGSYDRFRSRIMFPICDTTGRVVGFSGRFFEEKPSQNEDDEKPAPAKYINTPETPLYHKSSVLYGFDKAKQEIRKENTAFLVEGQMDVVASHEAGVENVAAISGTSLTEEHLRLIARFAETLVIALDADIAGQNASDKSAQMALSFGIGVMAITVPEGKDPADLVREDSQLWRDLTKKSENYIDFRIRSLSDGQSPEKHAEKIKETIFPHVEAIYGSIKKDGALKRIAEAIGSTLEGVRDEYKNWAKNHPEPRNDSSASQGPPASKKKALTKREHTERRIFGVLFWQEQEKEPSIDAKKTWRAYQELLSEERKSPQEEFSDEEKNALVFEAEVFYDGVEDLSREVDELLTSLELEQINEQLERLLSEIRQKESQGSMDIDTLVEKHQELSKRKEELRRQILAS